MIPLVLLLAMSPWGHAAATTSVRRAAAAGQDEPARTPASPSALEEAGEAFARGVEAYKEGRYDEALEQFSRAQRLAPHPDTLFNLGLAQQRTDRHVEAWQSFEALLPDARDEQEREDILAAQATSRPHVAWLRVLAEPPAGVVCLDGEPMPTDEHGRHALLTTPGPHRLEVNEQRRALELEGGESRTLELATSPHAPPSRGKLGALAGLAIGGAAVAAGAGLGAAFVDERSMRLGLGASAAAAGSLAIASTVAALVVQRRARRWQPPPRRSCSGR